MDQNDNREIDTGGGAHIGQDANAGNDVAGRDIIHNTYQITTPNPLMNEYASDVSSRSTLWGLLNRVYYRSPVAIETATNRTQLQEGNFDDILKICLPFELEEYKECFNQKYEIHQIIAQLIYLRWEKPSFVDLAKLEEAIKLKLSEI